MYILAPKMHILAPKMSILAHALRRVVCLLYGNALNTINMSHNHKITGTQYPSNAHA